MIRHNVGAVTTDGFEVCGHCRQYLSPDNPGEWDGMRWVCVACLVAALLRIHDAMIERETKGR